MAVPARKKSKMKKRSRRGQQGLVPPEIAFVPETGDYRRSHHISLKGYYKGRKVMELG
ncbi:50S ribosomal protein L32 [Enterococcus canis]|uniref:Large ribosomal subunit protein bL32 n=1 Tax=Enterococcus canis TaxID=214095 RepID=A0A1L8RIQ5_9ENTE|nr:50S ribosomal protein L32 [Enterococcus canis]OJG19637.1 50S ribosomal protein L32 [Enterococcus canis]